MTVSQPRNGPVPEVAAGRKRAFAGTAPGRDGSGSATGRAVHTGLRPEDEALLSGLRNGDPAAIETLFDRYHGKVFGLAMSILKNASDAEEAVQDVFLTVVRKAELFRGNSALYSWIYRICVNTCLMRLRRGKRNETVPLDGFLPVFTTEGTHARPVEDWSREVDRRILDKELGQVIRKFSERLPLKYRVVFALCDVQGLSYEETAQTLELSVASVKSRLHRARLFMRERLGRYLLDGSVV